MFACSFMFIPGNLDDEFYALDGVIDDYARSLEGFVGVDRWWSEDKSSKNVVYFFTDKATVDTFARFPEHVRAKKDYARWYEGYQVIISEVTATYGDGKMPGLTLS
ncbi:MAG: hypothetical protein ACO35C_02800 [Pontimonas sp.]